MNTKTQQQSKTTQPPQANSGKPGTAVSAPAKAGLAVVPPVGGAVAPVGFEADAGKGVEGADKASFAIPFVAVLQTNSPACEIVDDRTGATAVPGARAGLFMDTVSNAVFAPPIPLIPVAFQRRYIAWAPRSSGGGFKGEFKPSEIDSPANPHGWKNVEIEAEGKKRNVMMLPSGDILRDTRTHFVLRVDYERQAVKQSLFSLSSTQIKKSKKWLSRIDDLVIPGANGKPFKPASFAHVYEIGTVKEENDAGKWYGIEIGQPRLLDLSNEFEAAVYAKAREFHALILEGKVEVSAPTQDVGAGEGSEEAFEQAAK